MGGRGIAKQVARDRGSRWEKNARWSKPNAGKLAAIQPGGVRRGERGRGRGRRKENKMYTMGGRGPWQPSWQQLGQRRGNTLCTRKQQTRQLPQQHNDIIMNCNNKQEHQQRQQVRSRPRPLSELALRTRSLPSQISLTICSVVASIRYTSYSIGKGAVWGVVCVTVS